MKQKMLKLIAICLVLVSLVPYASAAGQGVNLWSEDGIDLNNVVINVGDTVSIGCDANDWAYTAAPNHNHTVIAVRASGFGIQMSGTKQPGAGIMVSVTGVAAGRATLTFTIQAGFSENPEDEDTTIDEVYGTTSVTVPITVIGEEEPDVPDVYVELPFINIIDGQGRVCSGSVVAPQVNEPTQFAVGLDNKHWSRITVVDKNNIPNTVYAFGDGYQEEYTGYVLTKASNVRWSLNAKESEFEIQKSNDGGLAVSVVCKKDGASGILTAFMIVDKVVGGVMTGEQMTVSEKVVLMSEEKEKELIAGEIFEDVDVEKVPNPFANLTKDAWYYDSFMTAYAWGLLDGIDFSENQDGSMILSMKKTVFDGSEENVAATFVSENDWSAKTLSTANMGAVLHALGNSPATVKRLANTQSSEFKKPGVPGKRGELVQQIFNGEKNLNKNIGSYVQNPFTDVFAGKPYYDAVLWGANKGVINGYGNGTFCPERSISRQEFCAILYRYAKNNNITLLTKEAVKTFKDAGKIEDWAKAAVAACQGAGIVNGYPDGTFHPNDTIRFDEAVAMVRRFF